MMTEEEMRDAEVPWPKTQKELTDYIKKLLDQEHDYGTCVYAMSMASVATFQYIAHKLGVTGFQASCADMDILKRIRNMKHGFRIINYEDLLYPQYLYDGHFPTWQSLVEENKERLSKEAKRLLANETACDEVRNHWKWLASLVE